MPSQGACADGLDPYQTYYAAIACYEIGGRYVRGHWGEWTIYGKYPVINCTTDGSKAEGADRRARSGRHRRERARGGDPLEPEPLRGKKGVYPEFVSDAADGETELVKLNKIGFRL